jgi:hypothetical protein
VFYPLWAAVMIVAAAHLAAQCDFWDALEKPFRPIDTNPLA